MGCWYCRQFLTPLCHNATLSLKLSEVFSSALHKSSHSSQSSAQFVIKYSDSCWTHSRDRVSPLTTKWLSIRENPRCSGSDGGLFQWNSGSALATDEALATVWFPSLNCYFEANNHFHNYSCTEQSSGPANTPVPVLRNSQGVCWDDTKVTETRNPNRTQWW